MHVYNKLLMNLSVQSGKCVYIGLYKGTEREIIIINKFETKKKMKSNIKTGFLGIRINYERFKLVSNSVGQVYIFVSFNKTC